MTAASTPTLIASPLDTIRVLFCGHDMANGYHFTKQALSSHPNILVTRCARDEVPSALSNPREPIHVLIPLMTAMTRDMIASSSHSLRLILQYGVGLEAVDMAAATQHHILVSNIPSANTGNAASCAEMALYHALGLLRHRWAMDESIKRGVIGAPMGMMLGGKTVHVIGFGSIAVKLIPLLKALGCIVTAQRRSPWPQHEAGEEERRAASMLFDRGTAADEGRLLPQAHVIIVTCPLTHENRGMVNAPFLSKCKEGVYIVNVARGGLLDRDACRMGLESGVIGGLGLDVQWDEPIPVNDYFARHERVLLTPHVAGVTDTSYKNMAHVVAEAVQCVREGRMPPRILNLHSVVESLGRGGVGSGGWMIRKEGEEDSGSR